MTEVAIFENPRPPAQRKVGFTGKLMTAGAGGVAFLYLYFIGWPAITAHFSSGVNPYHYLHAGFFGSVCLYLLFEIRAGLFRRPRLWFPMEIGLFVFPLLIGIVALMLADEGTLEESFYPDGMKASFYTVIGVFGVLFVSSRDVMNFAFVRRVEDFLIFVLGAGLLCFAFFSMPVSYFWGAGVHMWLAFLILALPTGFLIATEWIKEHPIYRRFFIIGRGGSARFGGIFTFIKFDFDRWMRMAGRKWSTGREGDDGSLYRYCGQGPIYAGKTLWEDDPRFGGRHIGINDETHMLTVARTGGGKSYYAAWNTLMMWPGGAFILDPKGEHYERTGEGHAVYDPWNVTGKRSVKLDPLAMIDVEDPRASADLLNLMKASFVETKGESANARHFRKNGEIVARGVTAHGLTTWDKEFHNLPSVFDALLTGDPTGGAADPDAFNALIDDMATNEALGRAPMNAAKVLKEAGENERGGFITTAISSLEWVNDPSIRPTLQGNTFDLKSMKRDMKRLYFVIPFIAMRNHSSFMRTMVQAALLSTREHTTHGRRCLVLLDEFYQLGRFTSVTKDLAALRSQEVKMWVMVQNIGQLKEHYEDWQGFMSACNKQFFAVEDEETAEVISKRLGEYVETWQTQDGGRGKARRHEEKQRPLRTPSEVMEEIKEKSGVQYFIPVDGNPMRLRLVPFTENFSSREYGSVSHNRHG